MERNLEILINAKDAASATIKKVNREMKTIAPTVNKANKEVKKMSSGFSELGGVMASVLSVGAIIGFGKQLLSLGSDLEEVTSKFDTVFSGISEEAKATFDTMAEAVGRSKLEMYEFSSSLGDVIKPLGFTTQEALLLSENMVKLAIDTASFNNVTDAQAINAFKGALTGEREALKSLGIVISEADLKTEAYTSGIAKQGAVLTKQQKTLATYNLLLANTADAQGDAVRTSKSFANQWKRMTGVIKDSFASAGKDIAQQTSGLLEDVANFIATYGKLIIGTVGEIGKTIGGVLYEAASGIAKLFTFLVNTTAQATGDTNENVLTMGQAFAKVGQIFAIGIKSIRLALVAIGSYIGALVSGIVLTFDKMVNVIMGSFKLMGAGIVGAFEYIVNAVGSAISAVVNVVIDGVNVVIDQVNKVGAGLSRLDEMDISVDFGMDSTAILNDIEKVTTDVSDIGGAFGEAFGAASDVSIKELDKISDYYVESQNSIKNSTKNSTNAIGDSYSTLFDDIGGLADKYKDNLQDAGKKGAAGIKEAEQALKPLQKAFEDTKKAINKTEDEIKKLSDEFNEFKNEGKRAILDVNKELQNLKQEAKDINISFDEQKLDQLGDRFLDVKQEITDLEVDIKSKDNKTLSDKIELTKQLKALKDEQLLLEQNLSGEQIIQIEAYSKLNETQRMLQQLEDERKAALEQNRIDTESVLEKKKLLELQANQNGVNDLKITVEEKDGLLVAHYENTKGELVQLQDYQNILLAEEIVAKQTAFQTETLALAEQLQIQKEAQKQTLVDMATMWDMYNKFLDKGTKIVVKSMQSEYAKIERQLKRIIALRKQAALSIASTDVSNKLATGGTVASGRTYLVGERGPELFTAPGAGNITPNNQLSGSSNTININITGNNISNAMDLDNIASVIEEKLARKISLATNFGIS